MREKKRNILKGKEFITPKWNVHRSMWVCACKNKKKIDVA